MVTGECGLSGERGMFSLLAPDWRGIANDRADTKLRRRVPSDGRKTILFETGNVATRFGLPRALYSTIHGTPSYVPYLACSISHVGQHCHRLGPLLPPLIYPRAHA